MKLTVCVAMFVVVATALSAATSEDIVPKVDRFLMQLADLLNKKNMPLTETEKRSLREVHPLLLRVADDEGVGRSFWEIVRQDDVKEISAEDAKDLIAKGKIRSVFATHDFGTSLSGSDGTRYHVKGVPIASGIIRAVDPKGVFIHYYQE